MKLIGVIFPSITNPFFAELIEDIEMQLFTQGYKIILCNAGKNKQKESELYKNIQLNFFVCVKVNASSLTILHSYVASFWSI